MKVLFVQHQDDAPPAMVGDRLAALGARCEVVAAQAPRLPDPTGFDLVVPLGSDDSAADESLPYLRREWELIAAAVRAGVPVFGICFGAQLLCRVLGGTVRPAPGGPEIGWLPVETRRPDLVSRGPWLLWHLDVMTPAPGSVEIATSAVGTQAFTHGPHLGVQFHPEATEENVAVWAQHYRSSLDRLAITPEALLAETAERAAAARTRTHALVDRVLAHAGIGERR
ncbi:MAG: type 1 glutamine amidotransferase, partial [Pseudonocardia sp.]|nr:type 1 glutamine amidotransferase [Pseudonocardia sp.]